MARFKRLQQRTIAVLSLSFFLTAAWSQQPQPEQRPQKTPLQVAQELQDEVLVLPEPYKKRIEAQGNVMELSLQETIRLALSNNLDIAIENFSEDLTREQIVSTRGFYDPTLSFSVGFTDATTPVGRSFEAGGASQNQSQTFFWSSRIDQQISGGGSFALRFSSSRNLTNNETFLLNPIINGSFLAEYSQPLWRGFRKTNTRRQLKISNLNSKINDLSFASRVADVIENVQNQYWELVFAIQNYETRRAGMTLAITQHENNQKRVNIGVSAPIQITSSRAEVALREQQMIGSEVQIIRAENALKRLLAPDPKASIWKLTLFPVDMPVTPPIDFGLDEAVDLALRKRPELLQQQLLIEQDQVNQNFFQREKKPAVNLRLSYGSDALTGKSDFGNGNLLDVIGDTFRFNSTTWTIAADVRIPLRNRTNDGLLAQSVINERRNLSQLKNLQQQIMVEVRNAFEGLKTQVKSLESARLARRLTEEQLRGENKRFSAGLSTNFQVLRFQRDLTNAQAQELRALIDYEQAFTALRKATYQIIEASDIVLARRDENH